MAKKSKTLGLEDMYKGELATLAEIAMNLSWAWNPEATALFASMDADLWEKTEHNPVAMLRKLPARKQKQLAQDTAFIRQMKKAHKSQKSYLRKKSWYKTKGPKGVKGTVAYFCMEYGMHESLPIYAGGLGILAGDHLKSASDIGLPLIAIGIRWKNGYVRQQVGAKVGQKDWFVNLKPEDMPITELKAKNGRPLRLKIPCGTSTMVAKVWQMDVGRVPLYLLDTDIPENPAKYRRLSNRLYCNGREDRICQEILLGVGGYRLTKALDVDIKAYHLNEGHAVFASVDRLTELVTQQEYTLKQAQKAVAATSVFTTHTPVPAGNETFDPKLVEKYFDGYRRKLKIDMEEFYGWGKVDPENSREEYGLTPLALRLSKYCNGVSALHGHVARGMWTDVYPNREQDNVPIGSITNGIHVRTWLNPKMGDLLDEYLPASWEDKLDSEAVWKKAKNIPDAELWTLHLELKNNLIEFVRDRVKQQYARERASKIAINKLDNILDPDALTIGFARRFAPYKRASLIFSDPKRLEKILNNKKRPVQILFAGKAHPGDTGGAKLIAEIEKFARMPKFRNRVVLVEDYSIDVSRYLVSGVDVWLNNPIRPQEASGTSGMKPTLHGGLNLSILDGWWPEGFNGKNGWAIGGTKDHRGTAADDKRDAKALYQALEKEVIPMFFDRTRSGLPKKWVTRMKNSLMTIPPAFNADRMVKEYLKKYYAPAMRNAKKV